MIITQDNYYSTLANQNYLSISFLKEMETCEHRALAIQNGEYQKEPTTAMVVGSYLHAAFESDDEFNLFKAQNEQKIWTKGKKKKRAEFEQADRMIDTLKNDPFVMFTLEGEKEVIYTGELYGEPFKIKVDNINHQEQYFADLKTTAELRKRVYNEFYGSYVPWVFGYGYILQMLAYREIIAQNTDYFYDPYIVAVTKENPPDKAVLTINENHLENERERLKLLIERYSRVKAGAEAKRCEKCDYCRQTKVLTDTMDVGDL